MNRADHVFFARVPDHAVRLFLVQPAISNPFVRDQQIQLVRNDLADKVFEGRGIDAIDDAGDDLALAADRANDRLLTGAEAATTGAAALTNVPVLRLAADDGSSTSTSPNNWLLALLRIATRMRWHIYQAVS